MEGPQAEPAEVLNAHRTLQSRGHSAPHHCAYADGSSSYPDWRRPSRAPSPSGHQVWAGSASAQQHLDGAVEE